MSAMMLLKFISPSQKHCANRLVRTRDEKSPKSEEAGAEWSSLFVAVMVWLPLGALPILAQISLGIISLLFLVHFVFSIWPRTRS